MLQKTVKKFFRVLILLYFVFTGVLTHAQQAVSNDIFQKLFLLQSSSVTDSQKVIIYLELSDLYSGRNTDSALLWTNRAIEHAETRNLQTLLAQAHLQAAAQNLEQHKLKESADHTATAIKILDAGNQKETLFQALLMVAQTYLIIGDWDYAINFSNKALSICQEQKDKCASEDFAYLRLGEIYIGQKEYIKAEEYLLKAKEGFEVKNQYDPLVETSIKLAELFRVQGRLTQAKQQLDIAAGNSFMLNQPLKNAPVFEAYGDLYLALGRIDSAGFYFNQANRIYNDNLQHQAEKRVQLGLGKIALLQQQLDTSRALLASAYNYFKQSAFTNTRYETILWMNKIDSVLGYTINAPHYFSEFRHLEDSIKQWQALMQEEKLFPDFVMGMIAEDTSADTSSTETSASNTVLILSIAGIIILIISIFFFISFRQKSLALKELQSMQDTSNESNQELEKINSIKDKLISIIGHDIRSPLSSLQNMLVLTRENIMTREEFEKYSKGIEGDIYNLRGMLDNMLLWAREQLVEIKINKVNFNIYQLVEEVINLNKYTINTKGVHIHNYILPNAEVFSDRDIVHTVFRNFFSNALKFTPSGKNIYLQQMLLNNKLYLSVRDEGGGIEPEILNKIKNHEFITTRGTSNEKGTGLGILFCQELLSKMDETFDITTIEGKGTSITFSISIQ